VSKKTFHWSGLNGATGAPLLPPMTAEEILPWIRDADQQEKKSIKDRLRSWWELRIEAKKKGVLGRIIPGVDPGKPEQAGWGIVHAPGTKPEVREALAPLVVQRNGKELPFQAGDSPESFLARQKQSILAPVNPAKVPHYLLLIGSPEEIPFPFQYGLDEAYAVGRLWFDDPAAYDLYVQRLLDSEKAAGATTERRAAFFAPRHPGDEPTANLSLELAKPLADGLDGKPLATGVSYQAERLLDETATRAALLDLLNRTKHRPALIFAAAHGLGFPKDSPRQRAEQGALVCQDWPGPKAWPKDQPIPEELCFGGGQVPDAALDGLIFFAFACYSAGTPRLEDFAHLKKQQPQELSSQPFAARLPQSLLARGALAFLGHVERAWDYSYLGLDGGREIDTFQATLGSILAGEPVGHAFTYLNDRYLALSSQVTASEENSLLHKLKLKEPVDLDELTHLWMAHNDARAYLLFGDPAARLRPDVMAAPPKKEPG
jgi:hypothetical protein